MRIGFFVWEYPPRIVGGLGTYAQNIAREYIEMGHDICLFTINPGDLPTREVLQGVEVHRPLLVDTKNVFPLFVREDLRRWGTHLSFFGDVFMYNILSVSKLTNQLIRQEKYDFDLICVHDWLSGMAGIGLKDSTELPCTFHVHSSEWGRALGQGSEIITSLEETTQRIVDQVITVSYPMEEDLVLHGWDTQKIHVCWNGVDPNRYNMENIKKKDINDLRKKYGITKKEKMVFFVGRLTGVKGVTNLVQAMPSVLSENPNVKLVILGSGELDHIVTDMIHHLGIEKNVKTCFEFVSEEERILHYAACDIAVFPSLYEPFGIVSLEAMSMGKPIVVGASGVSGFRDQVIPSGPDKTGIHVDGRKYMDIAWGINSILEDDDEAEAMGERARKRVEDVFTWKSAAKRTIDVYKGIIKKSE